ncbi:MAG: hypothetical protein A2750_01670 [Candidatus Yanofskybacteria bacterium RIFCSPHIGHO2_01_FULL_45_42]|uniref:Pyrroloquinoline quinone-dependent pyranose dehydrogenase beta-propeller domain-containing protein n=1 Tax=Candidatus Yanofskybacteria bacterium RIFCSPHIGHO2_01_FULL_45_42 TaxID=1802671 RepID=A0A1F8F6T8_9BACT|nr:MAG: hypothetical protein A2750_01670 [Candidatus Yanofskybacteria bacterium RIFCSPHIGHO2_01_FULL_45_42]OGN27708.1 MAG: hypothetical protein A3B17_00980 [Candidatus Yanofskybacteria bacterium RIFCSPLOWO2_01_FULL_45_72]
MKKYIFTGLILVLALLYYLGGIGAVKKLIFPNALEEGNLSFLSIGEGFKIEVFADKLDGPRVIAFGPKGEMLVSETQKGRVVILEDLNRDGKADNQKTLIENLRLPHGLAFYKDSKSGVTYLYIAEQHQVARYKYDVGTVSVVSGPQNIVTFPKESGRHFTRTIAFGPNFRSTPILQGFGSQLTAGKNKLYVSMGSSCDACEEDSWKRAAILESDPAGTYTAEFAGGLRNSVFFDFHPFTGQIWATEMGRDNLGDDLPPDEINIVKVGGPEQEFGARRYGWPFCYGKRIQDKTFHPDKFERIDIPQNCSETEPSAIDIPAHSAPLGLAFITSDKWPKEWKNQLLVAYHGSWNRSAPTGYKIVRFPLGTKGEIPAKIQAEDFVAGWLKDGKVLGRPVDLKFGPDGALYVSDDFAGIIYRITPN